MTICFHNSAFGSTESGATLQPDMPIDTAHLRLDKAQVGVEYRMLVRVTTNVLKRGN